MMSLSFKKRFYFIKLSEGLDFLKYFTLNTLFDTQAIINGENYAGAFAAMCLISVSFYVAGISPDVFSQRKKGTVSGPLRPDPPSIRTEALLRRHRSLP